MCTDSAVANERDAMNAIMFCVSGSLAADGPRYTGDVVVSLAELRRLDSRLLYDASASVDLAQIDAVPLPDRLRSLWLVVRGRNLGNVSTRDAAYYPRPGRNVTLTLEGTIR